MKLTLLKGLPASGKTTWAVQKVVLSGGSTKRVNKDDLREMIDGGQYSKQNEKNILSVRDALVHQWLSEGFDVIVDDTNLAPKHEETMREIANHHGAEFEIKTFSLPLAECMRRDALREHPVGEKVILGMWERYVKPAEEHNGNLPEAIICDLDGTLSHLNGRNPYDATHCDEDGLNHIVRDILWRFGNTGTRIVLVSGREAAYREPTLRFLEKHNIPFDVLLMRSTGDARKDSVVKEEIYKYNIKELYNVLFVLDDRDQVVAMWREQGLQCFQVNYGNF